MSTAETVGRQENAPRAGAGAADGAGAAPADQHLGGPQESETRASSTHQGGFEYRSTAGTLVVRENDGAAIASMFYTAYESEPRDPHRPITFLFNGGPGSASLWLNIGGFGPRRAPTRTPAATPPAPYAWGDNPHTLLPESDLVFIDAVGTGYSRFVPGVDPARGWGVDADIDLFARAVIRYLTKTGSWNRPRFLFGESYGTTRAAGLVHRLQNQGIDFNGVVLLSTVLNRSTGFEAGDHFYVNLLPSYAATARFHDRAGHADLDDAAFLAAAREYALGDYAGALLAGDRLSPDALQSHAERLSAFIGIDAAELKRQRLRPEMEWFREALLRDQERKVGRFDSRFSADNGYVIGTGQHDPATDDAATAAVNSAHLAAYRDHLAQDIGFVPELPYLPLNNMQVSGAWDWSHRAPGIPAPLLVPDLGYDLAAAMRRNEGLRVLVMGGIYDLATPFFHAENDVARMFLAPSVRENLSFSWFESGHMTFVDERAIERMRAELTQFYRAAVPGGHRG
ncbi:S10 family peptidase [Leucobacter chromiireducens]|uniref:S10 family peptidase n=1 Tax=Leucobacter chromiireducens TaxID=283877 RepID=UPI0013DD8FCA|nr:peptidase S10 [Leucobacter chromiireducens]